MPMQCKEQGVGALRVGRKQHAAPQFTLPGNTSLAQLMYQNVSLFACFNSARCMIWRQFQAPGRIPCNPSKHMHVEKREITGMKYYIVGTVHSEIRKTTAPSLSLLYLSGRARREHVDVAAYRMSQARIRKPQVVFQINNYTRASCWGLKGVPSMHLPVIIATVSPSDPTLAQTIHPNLHQYPLTPTPSRYLTILTADDLLLPLSSLRLLCGVVLHLVTLLSYSATPQSPQWNKSASFSPLGLIRQRPASPATDPCPLSTEFEGRNLAELASIKTIATKRRQDTYIKPSNLVILPIHILPRYSSMWICITRRSLRSNV